MVHSPTPTFIGPDWPYVRLPSLATPLHAPASLAKLVTVTPGSLVVRVNGLALYQFSGDFDSAQCVGVPDGVEFFTVNATGGSFDPKITVVPIAKTTNANVTIVVV